MSEAKTETIDEIRTAIANLQTDNLSAPGAFWSRRVVLLLAEIDRLRVRCASDGTKLDRYRERVRIRELQDLLESSHRENQRLRDDIQKLETARSRSFELRTLAASLNVPQAGTLARFRAWVERQRVVTNRVAVAWYTHSYCGKNPAERLAYPKPGTLAECLAAMEQAGDLECKVEEAAFCRLWTTGKR